MSSDNADWSRKCWYHWNIGHTTEEGQVLKDKIKELIQVRHLVNTFKGEQEYEVFYPQKERKQLDGGITNFVDPTKMIAN